MKKECFGGIKGDEREKSLKGKVIKEKLKVGKFR